MRAGIAVALLLLTAARADAQSAADKKRAQALQVSGVQLLEQGDNRGALQKFEEAIRIFPSPKILFNMGRAHAALGNDVEAVNDFERFLDEAPYAPKQSRAEAEKIVQGLRPKLSYIEIGTDDVGSRVTVDGREVGTAPLTRPLAIAPGAHEVRLEKSEMQPETRTVSPVAGQKVRVFVKLRPVAENKTAGASPPPPPPPPPVREPREPTTRQARGDDLPPPPPPPERIRDKPPEEPPSAGSGPGRRSLKWIFWGVAAAGVGVGAYGAVHNSSLVKDFDTGCGLGANGMVVPAGYDEKKCASLKSQYESAARLGIAGFVSAGVLAAAGVVFWLTETSPSESQTALASCLPSLNAGLEPSLTCAFRF